eukprot:6073641-Pleurochrysis_carterae.AAC.1
METASTPAMTRHVKQGFALKPQRREARECAGVCTAVCFWEDGEARACVSRERLSRERACVRAGVAGLLVGRFASWERASLWRAGRRCLAGCCARASRSLSADEVERPVPTIRNASGNTAAQGRRRVRARECRA